ncbi:MAG: DinB family protein [Cytophagales bacterium]|nr:DinB family protein [Cytophagales bacterium]
MNQFETTYEGKPWFGSSITKILSDVTEHMALWQPTENAHSIAQLVWHMTYWRQPLIKNLEGDLAYKSSMESQDNWSTPEKIRVVGWKNILKQFQESQERLVALLKIQDDSVLEKSYYKAGTYREIITGILQHDIYHLGQIAYIKSIYELDA